MINKNKIIEEFSINELEGRFEMKNWAVAYYYWREIEGYDD